MKKIFTLLSFVLLASGLKAQTKMQVFFNNGQVTEYNASLIDSIRWVNNNTNPTEGESTDPSVTGDASDITCYTATITCYASSIRDNLSTDLKVGIIYCTEGTPSKSNGTQVTVSTSDVAGDGKYTLKITGLTPSTTYYYRSFVYQSGLWFYGSVKSFTTTSQGVSFSNVNISSITCYSAKATATINGVSNSYSSVEYGICYDTIPEPTTSSNKVEATSCDAIGSYTAQLRALSGSTLYYCRPYAIVDNYINYGSVRTFQTLTDNVVSTGDIDVETKIIISNLTIGGGTYSTLELGVCYSNTNATPTTADMTNTTNEVNDDNTFTVKINAWREIYYRAYLLIDDVAHYGAVKQATLPEKPHDYVDLGLSSGTLWATCNIGAEHPEDYGDYYAWGETEGYNSGKTNFDWSNYKWCNGSELSITKYYYGTVGSKLVLDIDDDAAYVNWGLDWRMPSITQQEELRTECTWTWITENDVKGYKVTGKNGNSIFLPAAGFRSDSDLCYAGKEGYYWSRTLYPDPDDQYYAYRIYFDSGKVRTEKSNRVVGRSIRPVRNK